MTRNVAHYVSSLQHIVAQGVVHPATFRGMDEPVWNEWRARAKAHKEAAGKTDADLAAEISSHRLPPKNKVERSTVNSWFNRRDPNVEDFFDLCAAMGADPGVILFKRPVLPDSTAADSEARKAISARPTAEPGYNDFERKLKGKTREFKRKRQKLRRVVVKA